MESGSVQILTYTNLFPNHVRPNVGIFVKNRMAAFSHQTRSIIDVVAPVPYFPKLPWQTRWSPFSHIQSKETEPPFNIYHPRYLVIPKIGMATHGRSLYWGTYKLVQKLHRQTPYDLIDAHWIYPDGWAAVKIGKQLGIPVILSARGNDINEYLDFPAIRPLISWCLQNCVHVISVCQALKDLMLPLGIPSSKVTVIGNGIDTEQFFPVPLKPVRQQLHLPLDRPIILSIGALEPRKGHHILIEAMRLLKDKGMDNLLLCIVGGGPFRQHLEQLITEFHVENNVMLIGEVPHHELRAWYSAADIFCLASDREGWANVLLESIACDTPVVATNVYGTPEVVTSTEMGCIVKERSPKEFAIQIANALKKKWDQTTLVEYAQSHTWDKAVRTLKDVFGEVLGKK
jgi:teichuronic acid biosynthesis glycosyltransferase TuaC